MNNKERLIEIFRQNVKGKYPDVSNKNQKHDGKYGHWLEEQFNISANSNNGADILGYELKNQTTSKTSFGDWSANYYIFNSNQYNEIFNLERKIDNRNKFLEIFGKLNKEKNNRYSWSGEPCPKIIGYNTFGQKLVIDSNNNILAIYSYSEDKRLNKADIVPDILKKENLVLAAWYGNELPKDCSFTKREKCLKDKVENKFNQLGWFTCKQDEDGKYIKICFGKPINFQTWIDLVKQGKIYFDSGMYNQNKRPYSEWRADNKLWDSLIVEEFE